MLTAAHLPIRPIFWLQALAVLTALVMTALPARAQLEIDITRGSLRPLPIAVPEFIGESPREAQLGVDIARVVNANLERSGLFQPVNPAAFIERIDNVNVQPRFADWRAIGADALVVGAVSLNEASGDLQAVFRLWDNTQQQQLIGFRLAIAEQDWRRVAHQISDLIYERLTGEKGYFDTRIVYIAESGPKTNRTKQLAIMDQDGANPSFLTRDAYMVLTPRFSPTQQQITFLSYASGMPQVYLFDIQTGRREILGDFPGMTFAPRFSPDGEQLVFSYEERGNSDIWTMDLSTKRRQRLTSDPNIDTSPSFSPDGQRIVFNSDRGGSRQLYVMRADGQNVERISFGDGQYTTPVWSPRGDLIAFTKSHRGEFSIGVMRPDGTGERVLTSDFLVEGPTWSPNGRVLMFTRERRGERGQSEIVSIDLTGRNLRVVPTNGAASDPAWSPLLFDAN